MAEDGELSLVQSNAILRYFGRKYDRYGGSDLAAQAAIDMIIDGCEDVLGMFQR